MIFFTVKNCFVLSRQVFSLSKWCSLLLVLWPSLLVKSMPLYSLELPYREDLYGPSTDPLQFSNPKQIDYIEIRSSVQPHTYLAEYIE